VTPEYQLQPAGSANSFILDGMGEGGAHFAWCAGLWDGTFGGKRQKTPNAVVTKTLLHGVTRELLAQHAKDHLDPRLSNKRTVLVVIGSPNSKALYSPGHVAEALGSLLVRVFFLSFSSKTPV